MNSIFIGTRIEALQKVEELTNVIKIITTKGSFIEKNRKKVEFVDKKNKKCINSIIFNSKARLIFSAGYPYILPKNILSANKIFINSHPSILPFYKGRNCIQRAFENKEKYYGCTLHHMSEEVDSGKIIYQKKVLLENYSLIEIYQHLFTKCEVEVIEKGLLKILKK